MSSVAIVTDSGAAIPDELLQTLQADGGLEVVPMPVTIGERTFDQNQGTSVFDEIVLAHALGQQVQTSSPAPGAFSAVYRKLAAQGYSAVVSIHLSSELSATYNSARIAAEEAPIPVFVIDSGTVSFAYGQVVCGAVELARQGISATELAAIALEMCENSTLFFMIPTLDAIRRGGRVHPALARVGQLLQIRPVGTVENGKLVYLERPRSLEAAQQILAELTETEVQRRHHSPAEMEHRRTPQPSGRLSAVQFCGNDSQAQTFAADLQLAGEQSPLISPLPPVLSAHTGVGALATIIY